MKNKFLLLLCSSVILCNYTFAQKRITAFNEDMQKIAAPNSSDGWIKIKPTLGLKASNFFITQKNAFGLGNDDEMRLIKTEKDEIGYTHYRYQQYYKGYKVVGKEYMLHEKDGIVISANGKIEEGMQNNFSINISKAQALEEALKIIPAEKYAWQIPALENEYKNIMHNTNASYAPKPTAVWVSIDFNGKPTYFSAYEIDIYPSDLNGRKLYINTLNGSLLKSLPLRYYCTAKTVTTNFNGVQTFYTRQIPGSNPATFNLWNDCAADFIHTWNWDIAGNHSDYTVLGTGSWSPYASAVSSHWALEQSLNYYLSIHGRNGWDGANAGINIYQNALFCYTANCTPNSPNNASFGGGTLLVGNSGNASTIDDWNSLDILGHEMTHGVTGSSAGLVYEKESGALNESFSDIFGATIYSWFSGGTNTNVWKVGFDRKLATNTTISLYIRNMAYPNDKGDPDTYQGTNWVNTTLAVDPGDGWGVHTNSGVQNYMYYLLVSGGAGTNDFGTVFNVSGIGFVKARAIAYRTLTHYLISSSDYSDARNAWIQAAEELYGVCSNEAVQTAKAWNAVGADVNSSYYDVLSGCINLNSNASTVIKEGINSYTLYTSICTSITETATNFPMIFRAPRYVQAQAGVILKSTGTQPLTLQVGIINDCIFTNH